MWKCPICGQRHHSEWSVTCHIAGMARTYPDKHRTWVSGHVPSIDLTTRSTLKVAHQIRGFVRNSVSPDTFQFSPDVMLTRDGLHFLQLKAKTSMAGTHHDSPASDEGSPKPAQVDLQERLAELEAKLTALQREEDLVDDDDDELEGDDDDWDDVTETSPPSPDVMGQRVEAYKLVATIEMCLHAFIVAKLKDAHGTDEREWWTKRVKDTIRIECGKRRELDPKRRDICYYLDLIHLEEILEKNWAIFDRDFQKVSQELENKKLFLSQFSRLNTLRNEVMHPLRGETWDNEEFQWVEHFALHVMRFAGL